MLENRESTATVAASPSIQSFAWDTRAERVIVAPEFSIFLRLEGEKYSYPSSPEKSYDCEQTHFDIIFHGAMGGPIKKTVKIEVSNLIYLFSALVFSWTDSAMGVPPDDVVAETDGDNTTWEGQKSIYTWLRALDTEHNLLSASQRKQMGW